MNSHLHFVVAEGLWESLRSLDARQKHSGMTIKVKVAGFPTQAFGNDEGELGFGLGFR